MLEADAFQNNDLEIQWSTSCMQLNNKLYLCNKAQVT